MGSKNAKKPVDAAIAEAASTGAITGVSTTDAVEEEQLHNFHLGTPALICRWRLSAATLPLENRHLRALGKRQVQGKPVSTKLIAWAKQHLEGTLRSGAADHPDGVLMLVIDTQGQAVMSVGPYQDLLFTSEKQLVQRANEACHEAHKTGIAPETLWLVHDDVLRVGIDEQVSFSAVGSLISDLAHTLGITVIHDAELLQKVSVQQIAYDQLFLASDEYGIALGQKKNDTKTQSRVAQKMYDSYQALLELPHKKSHKQAAQ